MVWFEGRELNPNFIVSKNMDSQEACKEDLKSLYIWCMHHRFAVVAEKSLSTFSIIGLFDAFFGLFDDCFKIQSYVFIETSFTKS